MSHGKLRFEEDFSGTPVYPALASGEVQLWAIGLNPGQARVDRLGVFLSQDECDRAVRYRFERDRRRYTVRWGFLRSLLGRYLERPPEAVRFLTGQAGKPFLADEPNLHFNMSHSGDLALIAISRDAPLGVDLEQARPIRDADGIARRFFSPHEVNDYFQIAADERSTTFLHCWTRKEAVVKAWGESLPVAINRFEVEIAPGRDARVLAINGDPSLAAKWTLLHLVPASGFIGALAMERAPIEFSARMVDLDRTPLPALCRI